MVEAVRVVAGPKVREWAGRYGFSEWMVARFMAVAEGAGLSGADRLRFLDGLRRPAPKYVRCNPLRARAKDVRIRLEARGFRIEAADLDPNILHIIEAPISPGATMEHLLGWSTPQDLASAAPALALRARRGETVADLAAAPGIKSLHVAGDMKDEGALVCVEPDPARLRALRLNLERGGVSCALLRNHVAQELPGEEWADRVMVDAPCTGEGTIPKDKTRRHGQQEETGKLSQVQQDILDAADRVLRPGGVLVYATCTFAPEENEIQVARMIEKGYTMEPVGFDHCAGVPLGHGLTHWPGHELPPELDLARRFFPGVHPSLGFFVARLRKEA